MRAAGDGWVEGGYSAIEWFLERVLGWRLQWRPMLAAGGFMGREGNHTVEPRRGWIPFPSAALPLRPGMTQVFRALHSAVLQ
jgi:hypothetical protein